MEEKKILTTSDRLNWKIIKLPILFFLKYTAQMQRLPHNFSFQTHTHRYQLWFSPKARNHERNMQIKQMKPQRTINSNWTLSHWESERYHTHSETEQSQHSNIYTSTCGEFLVKTKILQVQKHWTDFFFCSLSLTSFSPSLRSLAVLFPFSLHAKYN